MPSGKVAEGLGWDEDSIRLIVHCTVYLILPLHKWLESLYNITAPQPWQTVRDCNSSSELFKK